MMKKKDSMLDFIKIVKPFDDMDDYGPQSSESRATGGVG
jgi:hypothetical protein